MCSTEIPSRLKTAVISLDIHWANVEENMSETQKLIATLDQDTDLVVLPELFSTGFIQDESLMENLTARHGVSTLATLTEWAGTFDMAIAGSILVKEDGCFYNRGFIITPDGTTTFYDKRHLFCLSPEAKTYAHGHALPPVVGFRGWNISLIICYDLRFPVWCRNKGHRYDMLIVPANWPQARGYAWKHLLIARAIENQAVVVGADRSGTDDYGDYDGLSMIVDPTGHILAPDNDSAAKPDTIIYATYSREWVEKMRNRLPVGADADYFELTHVNE